MPHDKDGNKLSMSAAMERWVPVAHRRLVQAATTYNGFITYKGLAEAVQGETGITHNALIQNWIGGVLEVVMRECHADGSPPLTALCVKEDGTVGNGYRGVHQLVTGEAVENLDALDDYAAEARLDCYRFYGAELPPGGGEPTLTPRAREARESKRAKAKQAEPPEVCAECNVVLPATGRCDECD